MTVQQICTFFLNSTRFGVAVEDVQEIIRHQPLTRVPLAASDVCGLMNLRGQVIPVVDLACRLKLRPASCGIQEQTSYNIIVNADDDVVSFMVDDIGDILECLLETLEAPSATLDAHLQAVLEGTYKLENDFLLVLNTQKILEPALSRR